MLSDHGGRVVDGAVIAGNSLDLYLSADPDDIAAAAELFADSEVNAIRLEGGVGAASAVRLGRPPTISQYAIDRIRRERKAGKSLAAIANGLNADRIPTAQGGRRWYPATIRHTLNRTR